jgi:ParB/RepB/Spo0J family partition protein
MSTKKRDFSAIIKLKETTNVSNQPPSSFNSHPIAKIQSRKSVRDLDIHRISPSLNQPRKHFDPSSLEDLASSIRHKGVLQPIAVKRRGEGFELIYGERRWRASKLAGKSTIPSIIYDEVEDANELRLIENIQREDLLPEELAMAVSQEIISKNYTQEELASVIGKSQAFVAKCVKISSFLLNKNVMSAMESLRANANFNIGFERLYEAACKINPSEGIQYLKSVVANRLSTAAIRKTADINQRQWNEKRLMKHLKNLRARINFSFTEEINIDQDREILIREIDNTISSFHDAIRSLSRIKEGLLANERL